MGSSESKSSTVNKNKQTIVNETTVDILNKQVNTAIARTRINNSTGCKNSIKQSQEIEFSNCKIKGDAIFDGITADQYTDVVDFKCVQVSKVDNEVAQEIMNQIMGQIESSLDSESLNNMLSYAEAEADAGFLSTGSSSSDTSSVNDFELTVKNTNNMAIKNIVENSINVELDVEDVQDCVNEVVHNQSLKAKNCDIGGDLIVRNINFKQGVASTAECIQSKGISQKIVNAAKTGLGVIVEADTKSSTKTEMEAKAKSVASSGGIGDIFGASLSSLTGSAASLGGGPIGSSVSSSLCILCLVIIGVLFYFTTGEGQDTKASLKEGYKSYKSDSRARRTTRLAKKIKLD
jgi:hypothetical protein